MQGALATIDEGIAARHQGGFKGRAPELGTSEAGAESLPNGPRPKR